MDLFGDPRNYVFVSSTVVFHLVLSGVFNIYVSFIVTIAAAGLAFYLGFEQLPPERLSKFSTLFGLTSDLPESTTNEDFRSRVILHRGGCIDAPENTLEAIREAARQGAAGVEIDLQFTADGVGVLLHDEMLERTTTGSGSVHKKNYMEIQDLDAAIHHESRDKFLQGSVRIPRLEDCLLECLQLNLLVFIDCKDSPPKTAQLINELLQRHPELYNIVVVCSFNIGIIFTMRRKNPRVITALTYRKRELSTEVDCVTPRFTGPKHYLYSLLDYLVTWLTYAWAWRLCGNSFLLLNKESVCRTEVLYWKSLGIHLLPWTVNSAVEKRYFLEHLKLPIITDGMNTK